MIRIQSISDTTKIIALALSLLMLTQSATAQIEMIEKRADAGQSVAQYQYGMYLMENGKKKKAMKYFEMAAIQNNPDAQLQLGNIFFSSLGKHRKENDLSSAKYWFEKAANNGDREAMYNLAMISYYRVDGTVDFQKAKTWLEKSAEKGYPYAHFQLGYMYYFGVGNIQRNTQQAAHHFREASLAGIRDAQYFLGLMSYYSPKKSVEAERWLTSAANQGYSDAQKDLARMYYYSNEGNPEVWYSKAAKQGDRESIYQLGSMYYWGYRVHQDYDKAKELYLRLAKQGDATAQVKLGEMAYYGAGQDQSYAVALEYYIDAAKQGNVKAQSALGEMYAKGQGTKPSLRKSRKWYDIAARKGDAASQYAMGKIYEKGLGVRANPQGAKGLYHSASFQGNPDAEYSRANLMMTDPTRPIDSVMDLYKRASKKKHIDATLTLAKIHYNGLYGQDKDYIKARDYFTRAHEIGCLEATRNLGRIYYYGHGVARNMEQSSKYFLSAALMGDDTSQYYCGLLRAYDLAAMDGTSAKEWFTRAANQGNVDAQLELGKIFQYGLYGEYQNLDKAKDYYKRAAKGGNREAQNLLDQLKNKKIEPPANIEWGDKQNVIEVVDTLITMNLKIYSKSDVNWEFFLNNQELSKDNLTFQDPMLAQKTGVYQIGMRLALHDGDNRVTVNVTNASGIRISQEKTIRKISTTTKRGENEESRIALVIGNADYTDYGMQLTKPVNDANDMAKMLEEELGFEVVKGLNQTREEMFNTIQEFRDKAFGKDVLLVYYSGHGIGTDQGNFLMPIDAELTSKGDVELKCVPVNTIITNVETATDGNTDAKMIIILDACRNNPFSEKQGYSGMQKASPSRGVCIMYAASYGQVANEDVSNTSEIFSDSRNSVFTEQMLELINQHIPFATFLQSLEDEVQSITKNQQIPSHEGAIVGAKEFYLKRK